MHIHRKLIAAACLTLLAGATYAQDKFPTQSVRIFVGITPGGGTDFLSRTIGTKLSEMWGQAVITENRPGAAGMIASDLVRQEPADGHTLMIVSNGHALNPAIRSKMPYDTLRDFAGITYLADVPNVIVTGPTLKIKTTKELLALIRSKPGAINWASSGVGTATHLAGEMFRMAAKVDIVHVPFKGSPEAMTGALAGSIHYSVNPISVVAPLITAGRLTGIALTTKTRSPVLPNLPTLDESGVPGFDVGGIYAMFAPAKTPKSVKDKIARDVAQVVKMPDTAEKLLTQGATPRTTTPEELDAYIKEEIARMVKIAKAANIRVD